MRAGLPSGVNVATCLGELLGKLVLVVVNVLSVHCRPFKKSSAEVNRLGAVHGNNQIDELFAAEC